MSFSYTVASTKNDVDSIAELVTHVYQKAGYLNKDEHSTITSYLYDFANAASIAARIDEVLVGTISIVKDSAMGLPMDSIFGTELAIWRAKSGGMAEVCQFAINKDLFSKDAGNNKKLSETELALELLGLTIQYCLRTHISYIVFAVNPKHRFFYEALGARQIGTEKSYPSVNNAPALAYVLDVSDLSSSLRGSILIRALERVDKLASQVFDQAHMR